VCVCVCVTEREGERDTMKVEDEASPLIKAHRFVSSHHSLTLSLPQPHSLTNNHRHSFFSAVVRAMRGSERRTGKRERTRRERERGREREREVKKAHACCFVLTLSFLFSFSSSSLSLSSVSAAVDQLRRYEYRIIGRTLAVLSPQRRQKRDRE